MAREGKKQATKDGPDLDIAYAKIFPPIGIARVGDSEEEFFFGPEFSPAAAERSNAHRYRDSRGRVKRQAARFRIYGFDAEGKVVAELTAHNSAIEWKVHLANKKAAWFRFAGAQDALKQFSFDAEADNHVLRNEQIGTIVRNEERQRFESDCNRKTLEIDGGSKSIKGINQMPGRGTEGDDLRFKGLFKGPRWPDDPKQTQLASAKGVYQGHEVYLGELRTDEDGRLIILGGHGVSEPVGPAGPAKGNDRHDYWITNYANNDHWYDDTSDGPISAKVRIGGHEIEVRGGAWVVVAPPDYAPDITNLVTLYDVMEEVAIAARLSCGDGSPELRDLRTVSFRRDILPILQRANNLRWVSPIGLRGHGYGKPGVLEGTDDLATAVQMSDSGDELRQRFFRTVRAPNYEALDPETGHPADIIREVAEAQAIASFMPPLSGDQGGRTAGQPNTWLTLTRLQYGRLQKWSEGNFERDEVASGDGTLDLKDQPARLTRCALEAGCGGAFYPGIEMTAIVRNPRLYSEAFRIDHGRVDAGDLTKFMACPWQADFYECRDDWWPGQRPDEVITDEAFEELFASFEEERKEAGEIEQVLFRRERWDRGLDKKPRPKRKWLLDRLLPVPTTEHAEEYAQSVAQIGARLLAGLTRIPIYSHYADRGINLEAGPVAEQLPNPWRIQYVAQEQFDGYAGRYFHPTAPSPEETFETPPNEPNSAAARRTIWQVLQEEFGNVIGAESLAILRRNWKTIRLSHPAFAGRVVGLYCRAILQTLIAQIAKVALEAPKPKGNPDKHKQANGAYQVYYNLRKATSDPIGEPMDFDDGSVEFKRLRAGEFVLQMVSRQFLISAEQSPDMAMVDEWRHLGFVTEKKIEADVAKGIASGTVQIETERPRHEGKSYRDFFYYLMNIEEYPDFVPHARTLALQTLSAAQNLIDLTGIYDPSHPESYVPYSRENFTAKLEQIYEILRRDADRPQRYVYNTTRTETIYGRIIRTTPFNQTDGAWLRYAANAGTIDKVRSLLFEVWSDEVGNGDPSLHHGNLFTALLKNLGVYLPEVSSRAYADQPRFRESDFVGPVFQLAISQHSEEFLPELLGMTLFLEWEVLTLAPAVRRLEYLGIDPQFWQMHVAIDNASEGHGAMAKEAVEIYLDRVLNDGGPEAQQEHWRRIWRGFVAFGTAGYDLFQSQEAINDEVMSTEGEQDTHPLNPADQVAEIIARKKHFGNRNHLRSQLGPHRINDLFDNPRLFLEELASSPWIVPGDPENSRLLSYLTTFEGPMYKVFSKDDLAAWRDWIVWLAKEGDTMRPKAHIRRADAMSMLLAELRSLMIASSGHRVYRVTSTGAPLSQLFASRDIETIMKALRDPANGWVVPFRPWDSPLIVDLLKPGRRMGAALDQRFPNLFGQVGRMVVYEWILSGCRLPSEPLPPEEKLSSLKRPPQTIARATARDGCSALGAINGMRRRRYWGGAFRFSGLNRLGRAGFRVMQFGAKDASADRRGETIALGASACLSRLGLDEVFRPKVLARVTGFLSRWGSSRETYRPSFVTPDAPTFCIDRAAFDGGLIDAAASAGVLVSGERVISLDVAASGAWCVKLGTDRVIRAQLVIDASGRGARFARRAGANIRVFDRLVGLSFVLKPDEKDIEQCVIVEACPDGWLYSALEPLGHRIITFFTDADISFDKATDQATGVFGSSLVGSDIVARYAQEDRVVIRRRWPAATLALDHAYAGGILALGDASMTYDPLSSQGIAAAMEDAEAASSVVAVSFGRELEEALRSHEARSRQKFISYLQTRCSYYRSEARWTDRLFWSRRHRPQKPSMIRGLNGATMKHAALSAQSFEN